MSSANVIGIDFGTNKTLVARWDSVRSIPVEVRLRPASGDEMPTTVHIGVDGTFSFGEEADRLGATDAAGYVRAFKRNLGLKVPPYRPHSHERSAGDLTREYLRSIKELVERESLHGPIEHAVIAVPVTFSPSARNELEAAAAEAGFTSLELLDEPAAAGLAFMKDRPELRPDGNLLVFDWGAGTLDLAVLRLTDGHPEVIPDLVDGDSKLGGLDIDRHLLKNVKERLSRSNLPKWESRAPEEIEYAWRKVNEWKISLAAKPNGTWRMSGLPHATEERALTWTSEELQVRINEKINEAVVLCRRLIEKAATKDIVPTKILLVGGSSQFPALAKMLQENFRESPPLVWEHRITAVARGAAWHAAGYSARPETMPKLEVRPLW